MFYLVGGWVGGWMGGWVVIIYPLRFSLFSGILTRMMCLLKVWCQKLSLAFISKVMINLSLKFRKFKADNKAQFEVQKIGQKYGALMTESF